MSSDLLPFLFLVTSTAIVLGVAVTLRGIYGFVSDATPRLPATAGGEVGNEASSSTTLDSIAGAAPAGTTAIAPVVGPRDLREPLVMTISGVLITSGALFALAKLVSSAP